MNLQLLWTVHVLQCCLLLRYQYFFKNLLFCCLLKKKQFSARCSVDKENYKRTLYSIVVQNEAFYCCQHFLICVYITVSEF